jgi:hypothetical protein
MDAERLDDRLPPLANAENRLALASDALVATREGISAFDGRCMPCRTIDTSAVSRPRFDPIQTPQ